MNKEIRVSSSPEQDSIEQPQGEARMREALGLRADGTRVAGNQHRPDRSNDHRPNDHRPSDHRTGDHRPNDHMTGAHRRHRFVQDGDVPVEMVSLRDNTPRPANFRRGPDDNALAAEKLAREQTERALHDITERYRELQTKLGHAELARDEAIALAARRQSQIDILLAQPPAPPPASPPPEPKQFEPVQFALPELAAVPDPILKPARKPRTLAMPKTPRVKEPQPVKWWVKRAPDEKA